MERAELKRFIEESGSARQAGGFSFLIDPQWGAVENAQAEELIGQASQADPSTGWLCVPTGGTSGSVRFARHDEKTISAAVSGFLAHFGFSRIDTIGVLPLHHVSGLMARLRSAYTGGAYVDWSWKKLEAGDYPQLPSTETVLSLVPTQLRRLLLQSEGAAFLRRFRVILMGGAPMWPELADAARDAKVPVVLTYGMTETAAMVAAQSPTDFAAGKRDSGRVIPHARLSVIEEGSGLPCSPGAVGRLVVSGESIFRGYFPTLSQSKIFETEDVASLSVEGRLTVVGRRDAVIMTGGKKVWPGEVEEAVRAIAGDIEVAVIGLPHSEWGETVVACFPEGQSLNLTAIKAELSSRLASYKLPKLFLTIPSLARNAQGKINRHKLREAAAAAR